MEMANGKPKSEVGNGSDLIENLKARGCPREARWLNRAARNFDSADWRRFLDGKLEAGALEILAAVLADVISADVGRAKACGRQMEIRDAGHTLLGSLHQLAGGLGLEMKIDQIDLPLLGEPDPEAEVDPFLPGDERDFEAMAIAIGGRGDTIDWADL